MIKQDVTTNFPPPLNPKGHTKCRTTIAIAGAIGLIIEITVARITSPEFGSTQLNWVLAIIVTLGALAIGYNLGATTKKTTNELQTLAGLSLMLSGTIGPLIAEICGNLHYIIGLTLATTLIAGPPLIYLGAIGPTLAKNFDNPNKAVSDLGCWGTIGSIIGAIIATITTGYIPNTIFIVLTGTILILYNKTNIWNTISISTTTLAITYWLNLPVTTDQIKQQCIIETNYGKIAVVDNLKLKTRYITVNNIPQNIYDLNTLKPKGTYYYKVASVITNIQAKEVLFIGVGTGEIYRLINQYCNITPVEINPIITETGRKWAEYTGPPTITKDGRRFINETTNKFDAIIIDAFIGETIPEHLCTKEAFAQYHRKLNNNGAIIINCVDTKNTKTAYLAACMTRTGTQEFKWHQTWQTKEGNYILIFANQYKKLDQYNQDCKQIELETKGQIAKDQWNPLNRLAWGLRNKLKQQ